MKNYSTGHTFKNILFSGSAAPIRHPPKSLHVAVVLHTYAWYSYFITLCVCGNSEMFTLVINTQYSVHNRKYCLI